MLGGRLRCFVDEFGGGGTTAQHLVDHHRPAACGNDELRRQQVPQHASDRPPGSRWYPVRQRICDQPCLRAQSDQHGDGRHGRSTWRPEQRRQSQSSTEGRQQLARKTRQASWIRYVDMDACHRLASKGKFYDQSVRVPFLMRYKGKVVHRVDTNLVSSGLDLLPTVCDYARLDLPTGLLGQSLRPLADSQNVDHWRNYLVTENHTGRMLRSVDFKYCIYREGAVRESLVNMRDDPGEMKNLATAPEHVETLNEHRRYLKQWIKASGDQDAESFALAPDPRVTN